MPLSRHLVQRRFLGPWYHRHNCYNCHILSPDVDEPGSQSCVTPGCTWREEEADLTVLTLWHIAAWVFPVCKCGLVQLLSVTQSIVTLGCFSDLLLRKHLPIWRIRVTLTSSIFFNCWMFLEITEGLIDRNLMPIRQRGWCIAGRVQPDRSHI